MGDDSEPEGGGRIRDTADAVRGALQEVPVYKDALRPPARRLGRELVPAAANIGKAVTTITEGVNLALAPLEGLVWGYKQVAEIIFPALEERFRDKLHRLVTPPLAIAGPAVESLRFTGSDESLREMYINLLETSMDSETTRKAHPSFVEIIRQMDPEEARLLRAIAIDHQGMLPTVSIVGPIRNSFGYEHRFLVRFSAYELEGRCRFPDQMPSYLDNLCRLGLTAHPHREHYRALIGDQRDEYRPLAELPEIANHMERIKGREDIREPQIHVEGFRLNEFGRQFSIACIRGVPSDQADDQAAEDQAAGEGSTG